MTAATPTTGPRSRLSGRLQFLLLALLFFAPFASAWLLYFYFPQLRPNTTTNYGELVIPVRPLPDWAWTQADGASVSSSALKGKWTLLQRVQGACDKPCEERILLTRQLRTALAAERERVQRVLLVEDAAQLAGLAQRLGGDNPDLILRAAAGDEARQFFDAPAPQPAQTLYLIDPLGNYLMSYPDHGTQPDFRGMQKDIKKLLKLSQIG